MSQNIDQIYTTNPAASMQSADLLYLGRSPYGVTDDFAIQWTDMQDSITAVGTIAAGVWEGTVVGITYGGTGVSTVTSSPTASAWAGWDANFNLSANNFLAGFGTTVTAAGNTVLTVASEMIQEFTGSTTQTVTLPVVSTLPLGFQFKIINNSSDVVTVNSSGGNEVQAMEANTTLFLTCVAITGTGAASWNDVYVSDVAGVTSITGTANQVIASSATGNVTLSTPQDIAITSSPTFAGLDVDNININGNTISSTDAAGDINLTPDTTGDLVLDGQKWPQADGSASTLLTTDGAGQLSWTTATFPGTAGATGTILRSNGTNWVASTSTFADTYGASTLLYSNGANTVAGLATANNGILVTSGTGVPSIGNAVGADITVNTITVGLGPLGVSTDTALGYQALLSASSGAVNTAVGYQALTGKTSGSGNTAVGRTALSGVITSDYNTAIGTSAGNGASGAAAANVFVGRNSGTAGVVSGNANVTSGTNNTFLGTACAPNAVAPVGVLGIGYGATPEKATGATSGDAGPGIAIGSSDAKVGFRGDGTIYTGGTGRGYWRPKLNGTAYLMPCFIDGTLTASASMVTDSAGSPILSSAMTDGQVIIGSTGATPTAAALTAGTGVSITNGAGSITINSTGGGLATATIAGTSDTAVVNTQYIALNAGQTTVTLPATFAVGDVVRLVGATANTGGWILTAATGDTIRVNNSTTSAGGTVTSSAVAGQTIEVICDVANASWVMTATASVTLTTA